MEKTEHNITRNEKLYDEEEIELEGNSRLFLAYSEQIEMKKCTEMLHKKYLQNQRLIFGILFYTLK